MDITIKSSTFDIRSLYTTIEAASQLVAQAKSNDRFANDEEFRITTVNLEKDIEGLKKRVAEYENLNVWN